MQSEPEQQVRKGAYARPVDSGNRIPWQQLAGFGPYAISEPSHPVQRTRAGPCIASYASGLSNCQLPEPGLEESAPRSRGPGTETSARSKWKLLT
jgi:hypothetical protein